MKAFVPLMAVLSVAAAGGDKEHAMMKKWAWGKAMASCIGQENHKFIMKEYKMHAAECRGVDAPELDLPFFKQPFRVASSLMNGALSEKSSGFSEELFFKFMKDQMMSKFARKHGRRHNDDDDDDDDYMPFRKASYRGRYRREDSESGNDLLDLGDRLIEKLGHVKEEMEHHVGNYTCKLQKCGIIDENLDIQIESMISHLDKFPQPLDPWVKERMIENKRKCYDFAQAIPENFYDRCAYGPKLGKVKMFKKCCKMSSAKTCMAFDIRQNLEDNFGDVDDLLEESQLEEDELYSLVQALMMDMDM